MIFLIAFDETVHAETHHENEDAERGCDVHDEVIAVVIVRGINDN